MPLASVESMVRTSPSRVVFAPSRSSMLTMVLTSRRSGTLEMTLLPRESNAAAISGNTAFLAPSTRTLPCSGVGPSITNLSINLLARDHHAVAAGQVFRNVNAGKSRVREQGRYGQRLRIADFEHHETLGSKSRAQHGNDAAIEIQPVAAAIERE